MQIRFGDIRPPYLPLEDAWIRQTWEFLALAEPWRRDLGEMSRLSLLPNRQGGSLTLLPVRGVYVCNSARGMPPMPRDLVTCLSKLGVTVLHELPDYVIRHMGVMGVYVQDPSTHGILHALARISENAERFHRAVRGINSSASGREVDALVDVLKDSSEASLEKCTPLLLKLKLFPTVSGQQLMSVTEVPDIVPETVPPVLPPRPFLSPRRRRLAVKLKAREIPLKELMTETLQLMAGLEKQSFADKDITDLVKFFLNNSVLVKDSALVALVKRVKFVPDKSGRLRLTGDLYDPSSQVLQELFCFEEDKFPHPDFAKGSMLEHLKNLGLRGEEDVKGEDVVGSAQLVEQFSDNWCEDEATRKAAALLTFLHAHCRSVAITSTLRVLSDIRCLPCLEESDKPTDYPSSLPLKCSRLVCQPAAMCRRSALHLLGSVVPVVKFHVTEQLADCLGLGKRVQLDSVVQHVRNIVKNFQSREAPQCRLLLNKVFRWVSDHALETGLPLSLQKETCVLTEAGDRFLLPRHVWVQRADDDLDLKPYRYPLPLDMLDVQDVLVRSGSRLLQDEAMLKEVLCEIRDSHAAVAPSHAGFRKDLQLVQRILDVLACSHSACDGSVLLPVHHYQSGVLRFKPAKECTVHGVITDTEDEEVFVVHQDILQHTAVALGALKMKDRALEGVEELDYNYGQKEELLSRLHTLLKDSYTDGFSVPKELIQNADDAGATEVSFLLDERENIDSRTNLISEDMSSLQGPALFVYNDALFTKEDFENIRKLGAETKKHQACKVGRFGLGFNAVYNLTDVPCFLSGHTMAMFDPQEKYLKKGPGLKLDFTQPANRSLLSRMPQQFEPFQRVFRCKLEKTEEISYNGTLFRFPFRTPEQAKESQIKGEAYSESKRREFLRMLMERAGSLLMFTQKVKHLNVFYLPSDCSNPADAQCLLTVSKSSLCEALNQESVLQFCTNQWPRRRDIQVLENVEISMETLEQAGALFHVPTTRSRTHWRIAWATGARQAAKLAASMKGMIPLAAVATLLDDSSGLKSLEDSPPGFYTTGHLFCFLPLPQETVTATLPVHINGTFALASSRRSLLRQTEDDLGSEEARWNMTLFADAVVRAYFALLENLHPEVATEASLSRYFELWPTTTTCQFGLAENFYSLLVSSDSKVFPVANTGGRWVSFQHARFLDRSLRDPPECGEIAWRAMLNFCERTEQLVDLPQAIQQSMEKAGQSQALAARVTSELAFYRDVFFPNIDSDCWVPADRDRLVLHALMQDNEEILELVGKHSCVPCKATSELRPPSELVHPEGEAAKLYDCEDGRFPQSKEASDDDARVGFCSHDILERLVGLGMVKDDLPWSMVLERARSVGSLRARSFEHCCRRAAELISYLSSRRGSSRRSVIDDYPDDVRESLAEVPFLPVFGKPVDWPFAWAGGEDAWQLAPPKGLYSSSLKELVASKVKVLSLELLGSCVVIEHEKKEVLRSLGVVLDEDLEDLDFLKLVTEQLLLVASFYKQEPNTCSETTQSVCASIYTYLSKCLQNVSSTRDVKSAVCGQLQETQCVWTGACFVTPTRVAFENEYDCRPYLFQLERSLCRYRSFFEAVGVKDRFEIEDVVCILREIQEESGGEQLLPALLETVSKAAQLLRVIVDRQGDDRLPDATRIFLPDRSGVMQPVSRLCLDDCDWLSESDSMKFVHGKISPETANVLGVTTKKRQDYNALVEFLPFGQHEELTSRIKRLLEGYTCDSSIFKELLQNADDAGATEVKFILDLRALGTERVPEGWEKLQGPALCIYSNSSFTARDMQGIQDLGQGSKQRDTLKTGQYGVGFNAVYHITDVPSFWTKEEETTEALCVMDPNCLYLRGTTTNRPGLKMTNMNRVKEAYSDMFEGYLPAFVDKSQPWTIFRLPLRTEEMAQASKIKDKAVDGRAVTSLLQAFKSEMYTCLLFLNNVRTMGVYTLHEGVIPKQEYEVTMDVSLTNAQRFDDFKEHLSQLSEQIEADRLDLKDIEEFEVSIQVTLADTRHRKEEWLVVHRVGFDDPEESAESHDQWKKNRYRLLPRGGVAVQLAETKPKPDDKRSQQNKKDPKRKVFCILPLPVSSKLPMHVNGLFVVSHESRRYLCTSKGDPRTDWNMAVAVNVIVPTYLTALQHVKGMNFPTGQKANTKTDWRLQQFFKLFPVVDRHMSEFWKAMVTKIYQKIAEKELPLFPLVGKDPGLPLQWVPVFTKQGVAAYFSNMKFKYFCSLITESSISPETAPSGSAAGSTESCISQAEIVTEVSSQDTSTTSSAPTQAVTRVSLPGTSPVPVWDNCLKAKKLAEEFHTLLRRLSMNVLDAPYRLFKHFVTSDVERVQEVSAQTVFQFLKSSREEDGNGCIIDDLPKAVGMTPMETVDNVEKLMEYVHSVPDFLTNLSGLPLCLRQSENLYYFSKAEGREAPVVSDFDHLLPGSKNAFVHKAIKPYLAREAAEEYVREMDILAFAKLLPETLTDPDLRGGVPCDFVADNLPSADWIKETWQFLQNALVSGTEKADADQVMQHAEKELQKYLMDWNIVPVTEAGSSQKQLYPVKQIRTVVYVPAETDHSNPQLQKILRSLPLVFLDTESLPPQSIVVSLVASIAHPRALLNALANSLGTSTKVSADEAVVILNYFNDNISSLTDSCSDEAEKTQLQSDLKRLPLFCAVDGSTLLSLPASKDAFCLELSCPVDGLVQWSRERRDPVTLVHAQKIPTELKEYLGISILTTDRFYCEFLLPAVDVLPRVAILPQMIAIRAYLKSLESSLKDTMAKSNNKEEAEEKKIKMEAIAKMVSVLKATAFIEREGFLYKANAFYSPHNDVFKVMCPERSPPPPYNLQEWKSFLKHAGIIHKVTDDKFIEFALSVETEGAAKPLDEQLLKKSEVLTDYLFKNAEKEENLEGNLLGRSKNIRFVRPSKWRSDQKHKPLLKIVDPGDPERLVSFDESCLEHSLYLVWSCCPVLDTEVLCLKDCKKKKKSRIFRNLGLPEMPPVGKVFQHVQKVCSALSGEHGEDIFAALKNSNLVQRVMRGVYTFLEHARPDVSQFKYLPIILDQEKNRMLEPQTVVIDLREEEAIPEHIHRAPHMFGQFFRLFKDLGVSERVTADHYAKVLGDLSSLQAPLHVEELKIVQKAVKQLFVCLKSKDDKQRELTVTCLYLPSRDRLFKSTELIFVDDEELLMRLTDDPMDMNLFTFGQLGLHVATPEDEVKRLPGRLQMRWLSGIVREFIPEEIKNLQTQTGYSRCLAEKFEDPSFIGGVIRLAYDQHKISGSEDSFDEEKEQLVEKALGRIVLRDVPKLITVLERNGITIEGSEQRTSSFAERSMEVPPACTVYVDLDLDCTDEDHEAHQRVFRSLATAVQTVVELESRYLIYLKLLCENVDKALRDMDVYHISRYNTGESCRRSIIPSPGDYIPVCQHCYLDNNFFRFYSGEHVGFEVHDPYIGSEESEETDAVFIYAKVLRAVRTDSEGDIPLLGTRYIILIGPERKTTEASVTQLYKFVRRAGQKTSRPVKQNLDVVASPVDAADEEPVAAEATLQQVLEEIRNELKEAWRLLDDKGRQRVVKRLYLKWHPDKNRAREEFCTRVVQALQRYVELLSRGRTLPADEEEDNDDSFREQDYTFTSSFFSRMRDRGRTYRAYYESNAEDWDRDNSADSRNTARDFGETRRARANPQPAEGRRWLRQAQADVTAARAAQGTCDKGRNWVCYMCHQVRMGSFSVSPSGQ